MSSISTDSGFRDPQVLYTGLSRVLVFFVFFVFPVCNCHYFFIIQIGKPSREGVV